MKQSNEVKPDMHCSRGWYPALVLSGGENIPPPGNWAAHWIQVAGLISGRGARLPRQNDSEQPGFILASIKASRCSISIFRTQHLKGQVPSEVFIFLSGVCALIEVPALCCYPTSTPNRLYPPAAFFLPELPTKREIKSLWGFGFCLNLAPILTPGATKPGNHSAKAWCLPWDGQWAECPSPMKVFVGGCKPSPLERNLILESSSSQIRLSSCRKSETVSRSHP